MKDEICKSIKILLQNDKTVSQEQRQLILKSCRKVLPKDILRLGTIQEVAKFLGCRKKMVV